MKRIPSLVLATLFVFAASAANADSQQVGNQVLQQYEKIQTALATDSTTGVNVAAAALADAVKPCECSQKESAAAKAVVDAARAMTGKDLATLRGQLKALSGAVAPYLAILGVDEGQLYFCPMAKGYWLQPKSESATRNPYLGKAMANCGVKKDRIGS